MCDMKSISRMELLEVSAPAAIKAFMAFDKAALADGAIPKKYKELMAIAVAYTTQCPYCIEIHARSARGAGARNKRLPKPFWSLRRCARAERSPTAPTP